MKSRIPNPNGANGTTSDPREQVCWDFYVESINNGMANGYQSAIKAGYGEAHALHITLQEWFIERSSKLRRKDMLSDAEKLLQKTINFNNVDKFGNVKTDLLRIQADVSKFVASTQGKNEGYSTRTELTGANGKDLPTPIMEIERND